MNVSVTNEPHIHVLFTLFHIFYAHWKVVMSNNKHQADANYFCKCVVLNLSDSASSLFMRIGFSSFPIVQPAFNGNTRR